MLPKHLSFPLLITTLMATSLPVLAQAPAAEPVKRSRSDITLAGAERAASAALAEAARNGWVISVAVVDSSGELVVFRKADGAIGISPSVAIGKARTAALLQAPSKEFEDFVNGGKPSFGTIPGLYPLEGGMPVVVEGEVIGAVGVSGAHGANDSRVATVAARSLR